MFWKALHWNIFGRSIAHIKNCSFYIGWLYPLAPNVTLSVYLSPITPAFLKPNLNLRPIACECTIAYDRAFPVSPDTGPQYSPFTKSFNISLIQYEDIAASAVCLRALSTSQLRSLPQTRNHQHTSELLTSCPVCLHALTLSPALSLSAHISNLSAHFLAMLVSDILSLSPNSLVEISSHAAPISIFKVVVCGHPFLREIRDSHRYWGVKVQA